jgi:amidase
MDDWTPPTAADITAHAQRLGLGLTRQQTEAFARLAPGFAPAYNTVARWWRSEQPAGPEGARWEVDPWRADDPHSATECLLNMPPPELGRPLSGVRVAVKASVAIAGVPLGAGSTLVAGHVPGHTATVVSRAHEAGAALVRTGRVDDLCLAITGDQDYRGPVLNPWNPGHTPWGSSAGAAALVASGHADAALLVDQAGSARAPGAGCGLLVLMPTRGVVPTTGALGFTTVQDRVAGAALDTHTLAALTSALSGGDGLDLKCGPEAPPRDWVSGLTGDVAGLRVGLVADALEPPVCDPAVAARVRARCDELADRGARVREVRLPHYTDAAALAMVLSVHGGVPALLHTGLGSDPAILAGNPPLAGQFTTRRHTWPEQLAETVQLTAAMTATTSDSWWLAAATALIPRLTDAYDTALADTDVLITPTVPTTPPTLPTPETPTEQLLHRALGPGITHTAALNLTGHPAAQIPAGHVNGLPVGLQAIAPKLREDLCLRIAAALEPPGGHPTAGPFHIGG